VIENTCAYAARQGYLSIFTFAFESGCPNVYKTTCKLAATSKSLDCLIYAIELGVCCVCMYMSVCVCICTVCVTIIQAMRKGKVDIPQMWDAAARGGFLEGLQV
jgi:hypothetical protein